MNKIFKRAKVRMICYACAGILVTIAGIVSSGVETVIKIIYEPFQEEDMQQESSLILSYKEKDILRERIVTANWPERVWGHYFEVYYDIPTESGELDGIHINLVSHEDASRIRSIEVYYDSLQVLKLGPEEIAKQFQCSLVPTFSGQYVKISGQNAWIQAKEEFLSNYENSLNSDWRIAVNWLFWGIVLFVLLLVFDNMIVRQFSVIRERVEKRKWRIRRNSKKADRKEYILAFLLGIIFVSVLCMALWSQQFSHPDETVSKMAIDYYLGGWFPPDNGSDWMAGTYSAYGFSRLTEETWYYFFAGKAGWLLRQLTDIRVYYRFSNVICLGILLAVCWRYRRTQRWMYIALGLTPQIWYLFSYATSDAWDFFWSFWVILLLLYEGSALNRIIRNEGDLKEQIKDILVCALVFSMVWLGKRNYFVILGLAFVDIMIKLYKAGKGRRAGIARKYLMILGITLVLVNVKTDLIFFVSGEETVGAGADKTDYVMQKITEEETKEIANVQLRDSGYSLYEVLFEISDISLPRALLTSMVGVYGWMSEWSGGYYLILLFSGYLGLSILWLKAIKNSRRWDEIIKLSTLPIWFLIMVGIVILYCWNFDYQPQGRYMLPIFLVAAYAFGSTAGLAERKWSRRLQYVCTLVSLYSFWTVGIAGLR